MAERIIKTGGVIELGLMVGECTGLCGGALPLGGHHGIQLGIVFGGAWWAHEMWDLTEGLRGWIAARIGRGRGAATQAAPTPPPAPGSSAPGPAP